MNGRIPQVAVILALFLAPGIAQAQKKPGGGGGASTPAWTIIPLNDGAGRYVNGRPSAINAEGAIVGAIDDGANSDDRQAAYWKLTTVGGAVQSSLTILPGNAFDASGINDRGEIVGNGVSVNGHFAGLYWATQTEQPYELPPLPEDDSSAAMAISSDGIVCGASSNSTQFDIARAVVWWVASDEEGTLILGPWELPGPDSGSFAVAVNQFDSLGIAEIAGRITTGTGSAAVVWEVQATTEGTLDVNPSIDVLDVDASSFGINNAGAVCGVRSVQQPVVWSGGTVSVLNRDRNIYATSAYSINSNGLIVGAGEYRKSSERGLRAVVWPNSRSPMILLDKFLSTRSPFNNLNHASAVDSLGRIVGYGWRGDVGTYAGFVAVPQ